MINYYLKYGLKIAIFKKPSKWKEFSKCCNCISSVMVSVFASSAVDFGF